MFDRRAYRRNYDLERYRRLRLEIVERLGGKCAQCGEQIDLQVDHINPNTKEFDVGKSWGVSADRMTIELTKCQLLCRSCHKRKSDSEATGPHGTWGRYRNGKCRCVLCKEFVSSYFKKNAKVFNERRRARRAKKSHVPVVR